MYEDTLKNSLLAEQEKNRKLEHELNSIKAQLVHNYHLSYYSIEKAGEDYQKGSAVILSLTNIAGKNIIEPTAIKDGLLPTTIKALKQEFVKSYTLATVFKPE